MTSIVEPPHRSQVVGRVAGLWRYPVKSMAGEALTETDVSWHGVAGDRRWGFVRAGRTRNGFPWLTIRQRPEMLLYHPWFVDTARPNKSATMVRTPSGDEFEVLDPALAKELEANAQVIKQFRGVFDVMPLSLITKQSVVGLGALLGTVPDARRFRPNIVIDAVDDTPFPEDAWVGHTLAIGSVRVRVDLRDERCSIINIDPATADRDAAVLRVVARERDLSLGVWGSTVAPGQIAVGDPVVIAG